MRSRAARRLRARAVLTTSSARAVRSSCAGVDGWAFSSVVVSGCVCVRVFLAVFLGAFDACVAWYAG